ncbi:MAG: cupredoxin domain-containing protein [Magnetovibrio sp.]|nr:cupredoxin domain-containing protein [Magnetovibrio sp.]
MGVLLIAWIIWFFWFKPGLATLATKKGKFQEISIIVQGGYTPDTVIVKKGSPVRLKFLRQESSTCSDTVVLPDFNKSAHLPEGDTVSVEFIPDKTGEFEFTCQMGMLRGRLIVEES